MPTLSDYTHIGRDLDPRYPYHRWMLVIAFIAGAVHTVWVYINARGPLAALDTGIAAGLTVGFAWILAREIDPDHEPSALVSAVLGGIFGTSFPALLTLFALLMVIRVVNRTTGKPALLPDTLLVLVLTGAAAYMNHWIVALVGAVAFLLDSVLVNPLARHRWAALACVGLAVGMALFRPGSVSSGRLAGINVMVALLVIVAFAWLLLRRREIVTPCDDGSPLYLERVQAAMALAILAGILALIVGGVYTYTALWAAMAGPVMWALWRTIRQ